MHHADAAVSVAPCVDCGESEEEEKAEGENIWPSCTLRL